MKKKLKFLNFEKVFNKKIIADMWTVSLGAVPIAGAVSSFLGGGGNNGSTGGSSSSGSSSSGSSSTGGTSTVTTPVNAPAAVGGNTDAGGTGGCGASNPGATDVGITAPIIVDLNGPGPALPPIFCWVAREVYGQNNIKWQLFRFWMLNQSPKWFLKLYLKHGESTASFLKNKTTLKNIIRIWMDYIISNKLKAEYNFAI